MSIDLRRASPHIRRISNDGQTLVQELSQRVNAVSVIRAMQIGYSMCCEDNGLPVPVFEEPAKIVGFGD